jgi:nucleoid-associated protein YgaU
LQDADEALPPPTVASSSPSPAPQAQTPAGTMSIAPSFDVVRVNSSGDTVIAGRAAPNAVVRIFDSEREIGRVTADARGEWVFVPSDPLPPGARELSLVVGTGADEIRSEQVVVLVVPERGQGQEQPLIVATPRGGGVSRILQSPNNGRAGDSRLSIDTVDYDSEGALLFSGRAAPGATVQVYIDNKLAGRAVAGVDGRWELSPAERVAPGTYTLRVDELGQNGRVASRLELPFMRSEVDTASAVPGRITVQPGDSLWRIARQIHGRGMAYLIIYEANRDRIRDPDLIYPGQVFSLTRTN